MNEYKYFLEAFKEFSEIDAIRKKVAYFHEKEITAWEKWLQLELMFFLESKGIKIWIEDQYDRDKRSAIKNLNRVDLTYRRPNTFSDLYVALELKINNYPEYSIKKAIEEDLYGLAEIRPNDWEFRAVISVAIYRVEREQSKYIDLIDEIGTHMNLGEYRVAIFGWESPSLSGATRQNYKQWLRENITV